MNSVSCIKSSDLLIIGTIRVLDLSHHNVEYICLTFVICLSVLRVAQLFIQESKICICRMMWDFFLLGYKIRLNYRLAYMIELYWDLYILLNTCCSWYFPWSTIKIDCITVNCNPVKTAIDDFIQKLYDVLVISLRKSIQGK